VPSRGRGLGGRDWEVQRELLPGGDLCPRNAKSCLTRDCPVAGEMTTIRPWVDLEEKVLGVISMGVEPREDSTSEHRTAENNIKTAPKAAV